MASAILVLSLPSSVSSLNDTVRTSFLTNCPRILGEPLSLSSNFSEEWILFSGVSSGTKSDTAAHRMQIDPAGRRSFIISEPQRQKKIVLKSRQRMKKRLSCCCSSAFVSLDISFYGYFDRRISLRLSPWVKGSTDLSLQKKITAQPASRSFSARIEPLSPVEKFSISLTVFFYKGTAVPPDVTQAIGLPSCFICSMN